MYFSLHLNWRKSSYLFDIFSQLNCIEHLVAYLLDELKYMEDEVAVVTWKEDINTSEM